MKWRKIKTAPKDGTFILLFLTGKGYHSDRLCNIVIGAHTDRGWYSTSDGYSGQVSAEPSHWMPLPRVPEADHAQG